MKRYNLFFPGLNPWITLGELKRCAEDYTKLFKDGKLAHPQFISHIYNLSLAHFALTTEQIIDFYQLDIVRRGQPPGAGEDKFCIMLRRLTRG